MQAKIRLFYDTRCFCAVHIAKPRARISHHRSPVSVCPSHAMWKHRAQSRNRRSAKRPKTAISSILSLETRISKRRYLTLRERHVRSPLRCNSTRQNEESHCAVPIFLLHIFPKTPQLSHQTRLLLFITHSFLPSRTRVYAHSASLRFLPSPFTSKNKPLINKYLR